jgi:hypothetical protein
MQSCNKPIPQQGQTKDLRFAQKEYKKENKEKRSKILIPKNKKTKIQGINFKQNCSIKSPHVYLASDWREKK